MLTSLSIRNILLVDRLDIEFQSGLCVLTGETGAGKSILLDALDLAIGGRADYKLLRRGPTPQNRSVVIASFDLPRKHIARKKLAEKNIEISDIDEPIIMRRVLTPDNRSRAFINDQNVSVGTLRLIGEVLIEIEGQFASHGLLNSSNHRSTLDDYGGITELLTQTQSCWQNYKDVEKELLCEQREIELLTAESEYLKHVCSELDEIDPQEGEEATLVAARSLMMNAAKLSEVINTSINILEEDDGVKSKLSRLVRSLEQINEQTGGSITPAIEAIITAEENTSIATEILQDTLNQTNQHPHELDRVEERLFALRAIARKHNTEIDSLADIRDNFGKKLTRIQNAANNLSKLEKKQKNARELYENSALQLHDERLVVAQNLDKAVNKELPHLRLEKAQFTTNVKTLKKPEWSKHGIDGVTFEIQTNPGQPGGPINEVASGGELARLLLALQVTLFSTNRVCTLVFDEVDSGVSGATAASIAERLSRLAKGVQVLVVTHSPQVAARAEQHFHVRKIINTGANGEDTITTAAELSTESRREEIARMLAGARITNEARAAAERLLADPVLQE
ncbi:MAG: DNA repair protein RecN [Pseudomonadota bacterium]|nr:DNA repair protein RecN [Pseudomonadota bacterium]